VIGRSVAKEQREEDDVVHRRDSMKIFGQGDVAGVLLV
jgi:hypothetical protein